VSFIENKQERDKQKKDFIKSSIHLDSAKDQLEANGTEISAYLNCSILEVINELLMWKSRYLFQTFSSFLFHHLTYGQVSTARSYYKDRCPKLHAGIKP